MKINTDKITIIKNTIHDIWQNSIGENKMNITFPTHYLNNKKRMAKIICVLVLLISTLSIIGLNSATAEEINANMYAPILYFEGQETCFPIDATYHIDNSKLYVHDGETATLIDDEPTVPELATYTESAFFLDNTQGSSKDANSIISHYQQTKNDYDIIVYYHQSNHQGKTVLQYWFFYAYNNGELNVHEGDWEMIQLIIESNTPTTAMYSQHHSGQQLTWAEVDTTSTHPHVYVSRGSHANYFRSFSGKLGIASDTVGNNGVILTDENYQLVELSDQEWLSFAGRWGEMQQVEDTLLGFSGPFGPAFREDGNMWNNPVEWGESLPELNTSLLPVEWFLYNFVTIFFVITALSIGLLCFRLYRRSKDHGFGPRFFSSLYIDGVNIHSLGNILFFAGIAVAIIGLTLPWYSISADVTVEGYTTEGFIDFLSIDGLNGVQITYPGANGPIAIGSFILPFSLIIAIGFVFTFFKAIGVQKSNVLGRTYLWRGISLIIPFIILLIVIFSLGSIIPSMVSDDMGSNEITTLFSSVSKNPISGSETIALSDGGVSGDIDMIWGLGTGGYLMLLAGIILLTGGILLITARKTFY